jgi:hypothetical protein
MRILAVIDKFIEKRSNFPGAKLDKNIKSTIPTKPTKMQDIIAVGDNSSRPTISRKGIGFSGLKGDELNTRNAYISQKNSTPMYSPKPKNHVLVQYPDRGFPNFPPPGFGMENREEVAPSLHVSQLESSINEREKDDRIG